jgi:hypothetical protein
MSERLFGRRLARELSPSEMRSVGGADDPPPDPTVRMTWICERTADDGDCMYWAYD